jgi:hypothetical protein
LLISETVVPGFEFCDNDFLGAVVESVGPEGESDNRDDEGQGATDENVAQMVVLKTWEEVMLMDAMGLVER